jgi:hypothetical protein
VDNEFDEYRPFGTVKHLGADIDDAPTEFEALIEGTSATDLHEDHRDGLKAIAEVEQLSSPSSDLHIGAPQLRLHRDGTDASLASASSQADGFRKVPDLVNLQLIKRVYSIHKNIRFHLWRPKD